MIPNYQELMRPVLEFSGGREVNIRDAVEAISENIGLSEEEKTELLPSGKQTKIANRIHWARSYLKQAGLVKNTKRGYYVVTERGRKALENPNVTINNELLEQFDEYQDFKSRTKDAKLNISDLPEENQNLNTPDESLREAHDRMNDSLAFDLLEQVRGAEPAFFEDVIVELFVAMGYGGSSTDAGKKLGRSGDDGVDGVINQDPLGVDQIYLQAKRYAQGNNIGSAAIRDFFGALSLMRASKGIFVTTSKFSSSAIETAANLGSRIVLIDGAQLSKLMIKYNIGCRDEEVLHIKKLDDAYFNDDGLL